MIKFEDCNSSSQTNQTSKPNRWPNLAATNCITRHTAHYKSLQYVTEEAMVLCRKEVTTTGNTSVRSLLNSTHLCVSEFLHMLFMHREHKKDGHAQACMRWFYYTINKRVCCQKLNGCICMCSRCPFQLSMQSMHYYKQPVVVAADHLLLLRRRLLRLLFSTVVEYLCLLSSLEAIVIISFSRCLIFDSVIKRRFIWMSLAQWFNDQEVPASISKRRAA
jgi:hypothetical protein